jgi:hypothetical protein
MPLTPVVPHNEHGHRYKEVFELPAESVRQSREPSQVRPHAPVEAFDMRSADKLAVGESLYAYVLNLSCAPANAR